MDWIRTSMPGWDLARGPCGTAPRGGRRGAAIRRRLDGSGCVGRIGAL